MLISTLRPLLPLGSAVTLHNGDVKLMIIGRVPLYQDENIFGCSDYVTMRYLIGLAGDSIVHFSTRNIVEVFFEGFADEEDEAIQTAHTSVLASGGIPYQRPNTIDIRSQSFKNAELCPYSTTSSNRDVDPLCNHWWSAGLKPRLLCRVMRSR